MLNVIYAKCPKIGFMPIVMLKVVMLNVVMLNVVMPNVIMPNVVMPNVVMPNVVMLNVVAPLGFTRVEHHLIPSLVLQILYKVGIVCQSRRHYLIKF
jgi:hypothetical protein